MKPLAIITQVLAERGDRERCYKAGADSRGFELEYIYAVRKATEIDPQLKGSDDLYLWNQRYVPLPIGTTEEDLRILVECEIDEIEKIGISYE